MDSLWYKDAVFYQLHVKAFFDSDNDGIGDFKGLTQKLDYIHNLGVDTLWLLPFYPSPLRDDGYDIADYRTIHPSYGSVKDFRLFVREAHHRGLKVVTELVVNHTSDQHPWFQRARLARQGSAARDYYVWSDNNTRYSGTRIIFTDTEKSNWTWDEQAKQFYWHRFFSHQPDLNFDNPRVVREIVSVMRHWLDMGVDGMRLDAVPYLCEREGTNNENLPETHAILKHLRRALDESHPSRMLLAEANQWPEDVLPYFGDGDECHMAFHFPLMPRMYMAIAREDRHPITDIMRQTPDIPAACQWAIFLRNHDELTLEMVTDRERDYLWSTYASDRRARVNVGIRRRLAPLMDNGRRKIELLNSLLLSMPGTPVLYYGDEIGMGDNIHLGDRNGVRTPMQWSPDRNGGFSRADPAGLYLPLIQDPVYGYESVNVEAQLRSPSSLLNWMKRMIAVRRGRKCFGRGTLKFLYPANRKILAYLREGDGETVLCVCNLARAAQGVELRLGAYKDRVPVELTGQSAFPPIGEQPYTLTLPGYGFYWFLLSADIAPPTWHLEYPDTSGDSVTIVMRDHLHEILTGQSRRLLEQEALPAYLRRRRWFADRDVPSRAVEIMRWAELVTSHGRWLVTVVAVRRTDGGGAGSYLVPMAQGWPSGSEEPSESMEPPPPLIARLRQGGRVGVLADAFYDDAFLLALVELMRTRGNASVGSGFLAGKATAALDRIALPESTPVTRLGVDQSNSSAIIADTLVIKLIRRPSSGVNPEVELGRFLTETSPFANTPPLLGWIEAPDLADRPCVIAICHGFVRNQGNAWEWTLSRLDTYLDEASLLPPEDFVARLAEGMIADFLNFVATMGRRTAEMHHALGRGDRTTDPDFAARPTEEEDLVLWRDRALDQIRLAVASVAQFDLLEARWLESHAQALRDAVVSRLPTQPEGISCRIHGDYHLGQLLVVMNDVYIIDFEGEPVRSLEARRAKDSPLRDVAGMLRSFDYAAATALARVASARPEVPLQVEYALRDWRERVAGTFLAAYGEINGVEKKMLEVFMIEKACYEVAYEAAHRPTWISVPLRALPGLLG